MPAATAAAEPLDDPCLARRVRRELGGHGLAHDHRPGLAQARHDRSVGHRRAPGMQHGAVFRRHVVGVDDVLYPDRHAVQRAVVAALPVPEIRLARLFQRALWVQIGPGFDVAVHRLNMGKAVRDQLLRAEQAFAYAARGIPRAKLMQCGRRDGAQGRGAFTVSCHRRHRAAR
jgi:hypothetical protein